jgi:spermidine/putrescine transport system substrate-binding protein
MTVLNEHAGDHRGGPQVPGLQPETTNEKELAEARDVILRWKRNIAKFENEQYKTGLASGEFFVVHGYSGDIMQVEESNEDIAYAVPKEGTSLSCDDLVIPKGVRERKLAHRFINFIHEPDVAAEHTEFIAYLCPNAASYGKLSPEILENPAIFLSPEVRAKCEVIEDLGADNEKYVKIWDEIKAN